MQHKELTHALLHLRPNAEWVLSGGKLRWLDKVQSEPSADELEKACHACRPEKLAWQKCGTVEEKLAFLAKHLGLE